MKKRIILVITLIVLCFSTLVGCGKKKIDVMETLTLSYSGADGYGKAEIENAYDWEDEAFEKAGIENIDDFSSLGNAIAIEMSVSYDVYPNENLSNGDEVVVKAAINNEAVEEYGIEFVASEKKFTVEGLPEIVQVDLFENVDIVYQGIAPNVTASIVDSNTDSYVSTRYILDKSSNLDVGDIITITAEYDKDKLLENGYMAESNTKEFEVSNVVRYATELSDISEEAITQLKKQTEDIIEADVVHQSNYVWSKSNIYTLGNMEFLGNYFLCAKNIQSAFRKNYCYFVYKLDMVGENDFSCYYTVAYYDLLVLEDGSCSYDFDNRIETNSIVKVSTLDYYSGYEDLDKLYNDCVTQNLADYSFESTVVEK